MADFSTIGDRTCKDRSNGILKVAPMVSLIVTPSKHDPSARRTLSDLYPLLKVLPTPCSQYDFLLFEEI